jgi:rubrerythrin
MSEEASRAMAYRIFVIVAIVAVLSGIGLPAGASTKSGQEAPELSLGQVLTEALDDERKARATYEAVLARFGEVRPFSNIVQAEQRHEEHLLPLFERYDVAVPEDPWKAESIEIPASINESCRMAVDAEKSNVAMYDVLLASVTQDDVRGTLEMLRARSLERHLPAFERCAERRGHGSGRGESRGGPGFCSGGGGGGKGQGSGLGGYCGGKECGVCSRAD